MKLKVNSVIRLYSTALVGDNLLDYNPSGVGDLTKQQFQTQFDSAFDILQINGNGFTTFTVSDARAVKFSIGALTIVLPALAENLFDKNLLRCICDDGTHYFDIISITSLNDGQSPSCELVCSENFYYSYLFEIRKSFEQAGECIYSRAHINRFSGVSSGKIVQIPDEEGSTGTIFNTYRNYEYVDNNRKILWLYVTVDEDTKVSVRYKDKVVQNVKYDAPKSAFSQGRRVFTFPYGYFENHLINEIKGCHIQYDDFLSPIYMDIKFNISSADSTHIIDMYISNTPPPFDFFYSRTDGIVIVKNTAVYELLDMNDKQLNFGGEFLACSPMTHQSEEIPDSPGTFQQGEFAYSKTFGTLGEHSATDIKNWNNGRFLDPALDLYPFKELYTLTGEVLYQPVRTMEKFDTLEYYYYRTYNIRCTSRITENEPAKFYLNFWGNCNGYMYLEKDNITTFYRNNGSQYVAKMNARRIGDVLGIVSGGVEAYLGGATTGMNKTKTYTNVPLRNARGQYTGKTKQMLSGTSVTAPTPTQVADASFGGINGIARSTADFVSSFLEEEALKADLANSQNEYQNVESQMYPSCQIMNIWVKEPDVDSEEYLMAVNELYYYGYTRKITGWLGSNTRNIYDYKQCLVIYNNITSNQYVNDFVTNALSNGVTFWHLENLSQLDADYQAQISKYASKYHIANYEPQLD